MPTRTREGRVVVFHALTPLHAGSGQTTGLVDLPVQREVHTAFPMIASSGLKGSIRDTAEAQWGKEDERVTVIFGSDDASVSGAVAITDARILAFPVRSLQRVFVWVTCPMVLSRFARDATLAGVPLDALSIEHLLTGHALTAPDNFQSPLVLEDVSLDITPAGSTDAVVAALARFVAADLAAELRHRLVIASDEDFQHFVRHSTQISARVKLTDEKTVSPGALWYEEALPPETLLYALLLAAAPRGDRKAGLADAAAVAKEVTGILHERHLQIGGNETVGQGWCFASVGGAA